MCSILNISQLRYRTDVSTSLPDHLRRLHGVLPKLSHFGNMNRWRQVQKTLGRLEYHLRDGTALKIIKTDKQVHRSYIIISSFSQHSSFLYLL